MVRVFANGPGDPGSIPSRVIPKTLKMVLDATLLNTQHYKVRVKCSNPGKGVAPSPTPWCRGYRKGSLRVTHDYGRQLYLLIFYGINLHRNGQFLLNIYRHNFTLGKTASKQSRAYALLCLEALDWDALRLAAHCRHTDLIGCVLVPVAVGRGVTWPASSSVREPSLRF